MGRVLIILFFMSCWATSVLNSDMDLLWIIRHVIGVLLMFKIALSLDDLHWFIKFSERSILRSLRKLK